MNVSKKAFLAFFLLFSLLAAAQASATSSVPQIKDDNGISLFIKGSAGLSASGKGSAGKNEVGIGVIDDQTFKSLKYSYSFDLFAFADDKKYSNGKRIARFDAFKKLGDGKYERVSCTSDYAFQKKRVSCGDVCIFFGEHAFEDGVEGFKATLKPSGVCKKNFDATQSGQDAEGVSLKKLARFPVSINSLSGKKTYYVTLKEITSDRGAIIGIDADGIKQFSFKLVDNLARGRNQLVFDNSLCLMLEDASVKGRSANLVVGAQGACQLRAKQGLYSTEYKNPVLEKKKTPAAPLEKESGELAEARADRAIALLDFSIASLSPMVGQAQKESVEKKFLLFTARGPGQFEREQNGLKIIRNLLKSGLGLPEIEKECFEKLDLNYAMKAAEKGRGTNFQDAKSLKALLSQHSKCLSPQFQPLLSQRKNYVPQSASDSLSAVELAYVESGNFISGARGKSFSNPFLQLVFEKFKRKSNDLNEAESRKQEAQILLDYANSLELRGADSVRRAGTVYAYVTQIYSSQAEAKKEVDLAKANLATLFERNVPSSFDQFKSVGKGVGQCLAGLSDVRFLPLMLIPGKGVGSAFHTVFQAYILVTATSQSYDILKQKFSGDLDKLSPTEVTALYTQLGCNAVFIYGAGKSLIKPLVKTTAQTAEGKAVGERLELSFDDVALREYAAAFEKLTKKQKIKALAKVISLEKFKDESKGKAPKRKLEQVKSARAAEAVRESADLLPEKPFYERLADSLEKSLPQAERKKVAADFLKNDLNVFEKDVFDLLDAASVDSRFPQVKNFAALKSRMEELHYTEGELYSFLLLDMRNLGNIELNAYYKHGHTRPNARLVQDIVLDNFITRINKVAQGLDAEFFRVGGDEFAIIVRDGASPSKVAQAVVAETNSMFSNPESITGVIDGKTIRAMDFLGGKKDAFTKLVNLRKTLSENDGKALETFESDSVSAGVAVGIVDGKTRGIDLSVDDFSPQATISKTFETATNALHAASGKDFVGAHSVDASLPIAQAKEMLGDGRIEVGAGVPNINSLRVAMEGRFRDLKNIRGEDPSLTVYDELMRKTLEELSSVENHLLLDKFASNPQLSQSGKLYNMNYLRTALPQVMASGRTHVFELELNNFKAVNDNFGHVVGDEVLVQTAASLLPRFSSPHSFVVRYGPKFFVVATEEFMASNNFFGQKFEPDSAKTVMSYDLFSALKLNPGTKLKFLPIVETLATGAPGGQFVFIDHLTVERNTPVFEVIRQLNEKIDNAKCSAKLNCIDEQQLVVGEDNLENPYDLSSAFANSLHVLERYRVVVKESSGVEFAEGSTGYTGVPDVIILDGSLEASKATVWKDSASSAAGSETLSTLTAKEFLSSLEASPARPLESVLEQRRLTRASWHNRAVTEYIIDSFVSKDPRASKLKLGTSKTPGIHRPLVENALKTDVGSMSEYQDIITKIIESDDLIGTPAFDLLVELSEKSTNIAASKKSNLYDALGDMLYTPAIQTVVLTKAVAKSSGSADASRVYLARDGGIFFALDYYFSKLAGESTDNIRLEFSSTSTITMEKGASGGSGFAYELIKDMYAEAKTRASKVSGFKNLDIASKQELFIKEYAEVLKEKLKSDERLAQALDLTYENFVETGAITGGAQSIVLVDTGHGNIPAVLAAYFKLKNPQIDSSVVVTSGFTELRRSQKGGWGNLEDWGSHFSGLESGPVIDPDTKQVAVSENDLPDLWYSLGRIISWAKQDVLLRKQGGRSIKQAVAALEQETSLNVNPENRDVLNVAVTK
ncbi:diguanylate cyclase [Candidatus Micrarchaeota archaeon]|nr:diguanylate cyclase [Candidatus Micrarchaeota archaeon]